MESFGRQLAVLFVRTATNWGLLTGVGTFFLYAVGYLALRFQLTALGVGTDWDLVDERYLFEGARFLIFLVLCVPLLVIIALPLVAIAWLGRKSARLGSAMSNWWSKKTGPLVAGNLLAVVLIECGLRQCLLFDNLLLRDHLPQPDWWAMILKASTGTAAQLYFSLMLGGIVGTALLALCIDSWKEAGTAHRSLAALLVLLVSIACLLLPVNYGVLRCTRPMPRVVLGRIEGIEPKSTVWLIWEGNQGATFLVHEPQHRRKLITLPRQQVPRLEIIAYDSFTALRPSVRASMSAPETLLATLERIAGFSASPLGVRSDRLPDPIGGSIVVMSSEGLGEEPLTDEPGYRSPIFLPDDTHVCALRDDRLVKISLAGGPRTELATLPGVQRLIGTAAEDPNRLYFLAQIQGRSTIQWYDIASGGIGVRSNDPDSSTLDLICGDERHYGTICLFVRTQSEPDGTTWSDVLIQRGHDPETPLTSGQGISSRQPALSHNRKLVVLVRQTK